MNRAMGFGIATSAMMGTTLLAPSPASGHSTGIFGPYGSVAVSNVHTTMSIVDYGCEGIGIAAQFKSTASPNVQFVAAPCGGNRIVNQQIVWYQKCHSNGSWTCSDPVTA
jgi:hypothetical protein